MAFMKMVSNRTQLYPRLEVKSGDNMRPALLGPDFKAGPDYMYLQIPMSGKRKSVKKDELLELHTGIYTSPHRCHVMLVPNRALEMAGQVSGMPTIVEAGESVEISLLFRPREDFDLTQLEYLCRVYVFD